MPQFFVPASQIQGDRCLITGDDFHHLRHVRRAQIDDCIEIRLPDSSQAQARIIEITGSAIQAIVIATGSAAPETVQLTLCMALLKAKKFEFVIQKAVEIGIASIVPVISERVVPDISEKTDAKVKRWEQIAVEAAKQSRASVVPRIYHPKSLADCTISMEADFKIIAHPAAARLFGEVSAEKTSYRRIAVLIGPEGGFSDREIALASSNGWEALRFGFNQLRAETAGIVLPALIMHCAG